MKLKNVTLFLLAYCRKHDDQKEEYGREYFHTWNNVNMSENILSAKKEKPQIGAFKELIFLKYRHSAV